MQVAIAAGGIFLAAVAAKCFEHRRAAYGLGLPGLLRGCVMPSRVDFWRSEVALGCGAQLR